MLDLCSEIRLELLQLLPLALFWNILTTHGASYFSFQVEYMYLVALYGHCSQQEREFFNACCFFFDDEMMNHVAFFSQRNRNVPFYSSSYKYFLLIQVIVGRDGLGILSSIYIFISSSFSKSHSIL